MIDFKNIKLGDKLVLTQAIGHLPQGTEVLVVATTSPRLPADQWITEDFVDINELSAFPWCFSLKTSSDEHNLEVKSDGGSSSYYQKEIVRLEDGEMFKCQTGDIIRCIVKNDFDGGNILKALDRIFQAVDGAGKQGTSIEYDCNKIIYFAEILKKRFEGK